MTKLEEEIKQAMVVASFENGSLSETDSMAKAAAEVSKKYIEKAYKDALLSNFRGYPEFLLKEESEKWLKEEGITE